MCHCVTSDLWCLSAPPRHQHYFLRKPVLPCFTVIGSAVFRATRSVMWLAEPLSPPSCTLHCCSNLTRDSRCVWIRPHSLVVQPRVTALHSIFSLWDLRPLVCASVFKHELPVHSGDDGRRGPTRWRRKTRRGDSNWQSYNGDKERTEDTNVIKQSSLKNPADIKKKKKERRLRWTYWAEEWVGVQRWHWVAEGGKEVAVCLEELVQEGRKWGS